MPTDSSRSSGAETVVKRPDQRRSPIWMVVAFASRYGAVVALILLVAIFTVARPEQFLSYDNIISILQQVAVVGIMALGLTATLIMLDFDLSIGWVASLAGMTVTGWMSTKGTPIPLAIILSLGVGVVIGLVNGLIVTRLGVSAFIATLAMGSIIGGVISAYSISPFITNIPSGFVNIGIGKVAGIPGPVIILAAFAVGLWVLFEKTVPGRKMYAIGGNREAARLSGLAVNRYRILAFVIASVCAAAAGIVLAAELGSGQPNSATGFLLDAFAAAFLGAATWREGEFHMAGTVIGVLIIGVIFNGLALLEAPNWSKDVLSGVILIAAVGASGVLRRYRA